MFKQLFATIMMLLIAGNLFASTGKLSGVVTDQETGEPLVGVNIILEGTLLGAATDQDGFYFLLNIPAGNYNVEFNYIGYKEVRVEDLRIVPDITKRLDMKMVPAPLELGETVVVVAEKPFFEVTATNTVRVLDSDEIDRSPLKGVNSIIAVNAGVVVADGSGGQTDNAAINVRGGRTNETLVVVDGIPFNDVMGFGITTGSSGLRGTIPDAAIEQVSSQLGGFSAKYGSAQSAVVNITTKSGSANFFGGMELVSSGIGTDYSRYNSYIDRLNIANASQNKPTMTAEQRAKFEEILGKDSFTRSYRGLDDYGYNQITGYLGGPILPGNNRYKFFGSVEYINTLDDDPRSSGLKIPTAGIDQEFLPDNESRVLKFTGKVDANLTDKIKITGSANGSYRDGREYVHSYAKSNSFHNPDVHEDVIGGSMRLSHIINETTFWDVTLRGKYTAWERMDGFWEHDLFAYGDKQRNEEVGVYIPSDGDRVLKRGEPDVDTGIFHTFGRVYDEFVKYRIQGIGSDFNFTKQYKQHLIEFGGVVDRNEVRYYSIGPVDLALGKNTRSVEERFFQSLRANYGYDIFGNEISGTNYRTIISSTTGDTVDIVEEAAPPKPINAGLYLQDRIEFKDFILNLGLRWDYFEPDFRRFKDPLNPLSFNNPARVDEADFEPMPTESYLSPRLGFAFPVTVNTVLHAQYGIFRQVPRLIDLYDSWINLEDIETIDGQGQSNGHLQSEKTTQYEFGLKQQFGNRASLDITAYHKNTKGLTNQVTIKTESGNNYITWANTDFGTIKGLAFSFTLRRLGPVSAKVDYTLSLSEGTGSSQSSAFTATFRNPDNVTPKAIAPLDFDQRHTLTSSVDIRAGDNEGPSLFGVKPLQNTGANFLVAYNSGRPYTPVASWNLLVGSTLQGNLTQYVNSAYAPGTFRVDLKIDKTFDLGRFSVVPYVWIQNLLNRENFINVWRSSGEPDNTAYLESSEGKSTRNREQLIRGNDDWARDYMALERDPTNYGIPRLVRFGLKMKF